MLLKENLAAFSLFLLLSFSILLRLSDDVHSSAESKDTIADATVTRGPTKTRPPIPGRTETPTPVNSNFLPVLLGMNITPTATPTKPSGTPTPKPSRTKVPVPGQTETPVTVNSDYMPVLLGMNITPTATPTVSLEIPTRGPTKTPVPSPP